MKSWQAVFILNADDWKATEGALSDFYEALVVKPLVDNDPTSDQAVTLIFPEPPETSALQEQLQNIFESCDVTPPSIKIEALPDIDWLQHVYETLQPIEAGRFFVHGKHVTKIPNDKLAIVIEAAAAFGTGEHPTTKGCLLMLDRYLETETPRKILDMGCGSGILALAATKALPQTDIVLGIDIDAASIRVAQNHAVANGMDKRVQFIHGDGFHTPEARALAPYDLVFGNILAQPLIDMAEAFCMSAGRDLLLSGFTDVQYPYVEKAYHARGCKTIRADNLEGWITLWLRKN